MSETMFLTIKNMPDRSLYACLKKNEDDEKGVKRSWIWTAANQQNLEELRKVIQAAVRLEPRSLSERLVAEISCENEDAMIKVSNENGGLVTLWSYTLTSAEKKYPQEEELAGLTRYWSALKDLAQG